MRDPITQLQSAGLQVDTLLYGSLERVKVDDDKGGKKSGWYVAYEMGLSNGDRVVVGAYGNWKRYGDQTFKLEFDLPELSEAEKADFARRQQELREQTEREKRQRAEDAAARAQRIFVKLPEGGKSDYLQRKKVRHFGVKFSRGSIVVPVRNIAGNLIGLQFIDSGGEKKFLTGTPKRGGFHLIGWHEDYEPSAPIALAEGYATAASIHMATGWMVAVAFDAGNLRAVAEALRGKFTGHDFIVCADDDSLKPGWACLDCGYIKLKKYPDYEEFSACPKCKGRDCKPSNTGIAKATSTARAIDARLCVPDFSAAGTAA